MNPIQDRLKQYIKYAKISVRQFESLCGLSYGYVGNMRQSIQPDKISSIAHQCPRLNMGWVLTGEGQMLKSTKQTELLADRLSEVIIDLEYESLENIAHSFGIGHAELGNFTNNFIYPSSPFDFIKFLSEYPEYNFQWLLTGEGVKFNDDEQICLSQIKQRIYQKNHPEFFPDSTINEPAKDNDDENQLWHQIEFLNEQLREKDAQIKEKDAQIKQLLDILQKK